MMPDHSQQPKAHDAVLGENSAAPTAIVLGGFEGVQRSFSQGTLEQRRSALIQALKYGEVGLAFVVDALQDRSASVRQTAYLLLRDRSESDIQEALQQFSPLACFECLTHLSHRPSHALALSPNGQTLISCGSIASAADLFDLISVWDLSSWQQIGSLRGHSALVQAIAIGLDGRTLLSASTDKTIRVWDLPTQQPLQTHKDPYGNIQAILLHPDGQHFLTLGQGYQRSIVQVRRLNNGKVIANLDTLTDILYVADINADMNSDSRKMLAGGDRSLYLWDLDQQRLLHQIPAHTHKIRAVLMHPDGVRGISASDDRTLKIWDLQERQILHILEGHMEAVNAIALSPDGQYLVSGGRDRTLKIWDIDAGILQQTLTGHLDSIYALKMSRDGQRLISGGADGIRLWGLRQFP